MKDFHESFAFQLLQVVTPASDCEADSPSPERNHKVARVIGELPIAQYSGSPRRYGVRENTQLPSLLSSPSMYMTPRPGFPQRVLPTTPNHNEVKNIYRQNIVCIISWNLFNTLMIFFVPRRKMLLEKLL